MMFSESRLNFVEMIKISFYLAPKSQKSNAFSEVNFGCDAEDPPEGADWADLAL